MIIYGAWFRQESAKKHNATLQVKSHDYLVTIDGGLVLQGKKSELLVSDRIGNLERKLTLPDGSIFASGENSAIDKITGSRKEIMA